MCVDYADEAKVLHLIKSSSSLYIVTAHHTLAFKNGSHWLKKETQTLGSVFPTTRKKLQIMFLNYNLCVRKIFPLPPKNIFPTDILDDLKQLNLLAALLRCRR